MDFHFLALGLTNRLFSFNFLLKFFVNIYSMRARSSAYPILLYLQHLIKFCKKILIRKHIILQFYISYFHFLPLTAGYFPQQVLWRISSLSSLKCNSNCSDKF